MPKVPKLKAKPAEPTRRTTRSVTARLHQSRLKVPRIPDDILHSILHILKAERDFKTLTSVARTNHSLYNMVIPMIYATVVFNRKNSVGARKKIIGYGHSSAQGHGNDPTRKDIATSHTRKLIFDDLPDLSISHAFRDFDQVVIGNRCVHPPRGYEHHFTTPHPHLLSMETNFAKCLRVIASSTTPVDSLHVKCHIRYLSRYAHDRLVTLFQTFESALPCTYESSPVDTDDSMTLCTAYDMQCVLHLRAWSGSKTMNAARIARHISDCFEEEDTVTPAGQLFLCDFPRLILTPDELAAAADNVEEAAMIKIHDRITVWPDLSNSVYRTNFDFLRSRLKLVKSGFKPSLADLYPRPQSRRGMSALMLPDDFVPIPDDDWSLTDEDPIDSEAEYSGDETSEFGFRLRLSMIRLG